MSGTGADAVRHSGSTRPDADKFHAPDLPRNYLPRPRLDGLLDDIAHAPVTVVCAPAGAGKSALLSAWVSRQSEPGAWITLDDRDRDPATFWANLEHAFEVSPGAYLVLDRAELLTATEEQGLVPRIAKTLPASVHLLIASRSRAPLALHRLRVEQDAVELTAHDLRFTLDEAAGLFAGRAGTTVDIPALVERTDGWATGLILALVGRSAAEAEAGAREFLRDEVLAKQPEDTQRFLMETAFLEYLGAAASERVTKRFDAADVIRTLERDNAFISPTEGDHLRYAYQRQFRDMLRDELRARDPERVDVVQAESARWCEERNHVAEAMEHRLNAGREYDALLLLGRANLRFGDTRPDLIRGWVSRIDAASARGEPQLLLDLATSCATIRDDERFREVMERAEVSLGESSDRIVEIRMSALRARVALGGGDIESHVLQLERARKTLDTEPALVDDPRLAMLPRAGRLSLWLALGQVWLERTEEARATLRERPRVSMESAVDRLLVWGIDAAAAFDEGHLDDAALLARNSTRAAAELDIGDYLVWPAAHVLAATLHERDDLIAARAAFDDLTEAARLPPGNTFSIAAEVGLATVLRSQGDLSGSLERLSRLHRDHVPKTRTTTQSWVDQAMALTLLRLGQVRAARDVLAQPRRRDSETLTAALIELADGRAGAASRLSASVRRDAPRPMLLASLIHAQAAKLRGDDDMMIRNAKQAMRTAQEHGFLRSVLDFGSELLPTFGEMSASAADAEFVAQLRRAQRHAPSMIDLREPGTRSVELTERELEVLQYLPTHLSIREIAKALFVSPNTVKTHAQHVYRKLGVDSREAAVQRARSLQVLR